MNYPGKIGKTAAILLLLLTPGSLYAEEPFPVPELDELPDEIISICSGNDYGPEIPVTLPFRAQRIRLRRSQQSAECGTSLYAEYRVAYYFNHEPAEAVFYSIFKGLREIKLEDSDLEIPMETLAGYPSTDKTDAPFRAGFYSREKNPFLCYITKSKPILHNGLFWYPNRFYTVDGFLDRKSSGIFFADTELNRIGALFNDINNRVTDSRIIPIYADLRMMKKIDQYPSISEPSYLKFLTRVVTAGLLPYDVISSYKYTLSEELDNSKLIILFDENQLAELKTADAAGRTVQLFGVLSEYDVGSRQALFIVSYLGWEDLNSFIKQKYGF